MDEYGTFRNTKADWDEIAERLIERGEATFCYCGDNYTAFIITITGPVKAMGQMAWGGRTNQFFAVGLRRKGFGYFDLLSNDQIKIYDLEEMNICHSDSIIISELLDQIRIRLRGDRHGSLK